METKNITSNDVIENVKKITDLPYPYGFGLLWALLTTEQKEYVLKITEEIAKERSVNNE